MRVLITNHRLGRRGGTQTFVRGLARGLQARGHSVMAFTADASQLERVMEIDVIPVAADLSRLDIKPDIIHAQQHLEAMAAITALPGVPAIYHTHSAGPRDFAPVHPRIYRYLAPSRTLAERMMIECGVRASAVEVLPNPVDLARFQQVRTLPDRPRRALFYNSRVPADSPLVSAIRTAAGGAGLELDCIGTQFSRTTDHPESDLPSYDIVFASGLSAIEAAASGCAVIVIGLTSCGQMVLGGNYERLREVNFSIAINSPPPDFRAIVAEIQRYRPAESAEVTKRIRRESNLDATAGRLIAIYERVVAEHAGRDADMRAEMAAVSRYFRKIVPLIEAAAAVLVPDWGNLMPADESDDAASGAV